MKKVGIINGPLSAVIATLGHTETLTIADAGLPIPQSVQRIDLALAKGVPTFLTALKTVLSELHVEQAIVANEMVERSPQMYQDLKEALGNVPVVTVPHVEFKRQTSQSRAVVRTGEFTPYSNVILVAGAWGFDLNPGD